ncbi:hypothetical protein ACSSZE_03300 [Acidithiobacillus caldus]
MAETENCILQKTVFLFCGVNMGFWTFVKKDLGYYKKLARTETRFHKLVWNKLMHVQNNTEERLPWNTLDEKLRKQRLKQERFVLFSMILLLVLLTVYLVWSRNWEGFAVWLMFVSLVVRSLVIIRKLKKENNHALLR